jgi:hypothetical protein
MKEGYSQNLWLLGEEHALTEVSLLSRSANSVRPCCPELTI